MTGLTIRPYRPSDRDRLVALWDRCGLVVSYNDPDRDIALFERSPNAAIFIGEFDERIIAAACIGHDGHRGYPYYVSVDPEAQGRGYGRAIMRHAEDWLRQRGVPKINIMVRETNEKVVAFYRSIGYEDTPRFVLGKFLTPDGQAPSGPTAVAGNIACTITYLEMTARPAHTPVPLPHRVKVALLRAVKPGPAFYRYLYDRVGEAWLWYERRALSDQALAAIVDDERVEIYVLYVDGVPAGYFELDRREVPDIELVYFGLMPEFIGRRLGPYLLSSAIDLAWTYEPRRLWVNTNTLDHPKALPLYQRFGFVPYKREDTSIPDPRLQGLIP
jgi:GNAT superfamily N-acetyltransferase